MPSLRADALALAVGFGVCMSVAACSPPTGYEDVDVLVPPAAVIKLDGCPRNASVLAYDDDARPRAGSVPDGFTPIRLTRCVVDLTLTELRNAVRYTIREDRATPTPELLRILELPDRRFANPRVACAAAKGPPRSVFLTNRAGNSIRVRLPQDPCGIRPEVDPGLAALEYSRAVRYYVDVPQ